MDEYRGFWVDWYGDGDPDGDGGGDGFGDGDRDKDEARCGDWYENGSGWGRCPRSHRAG